jgi:hypothetical protein
MVEKSTVNNTFCTDSSQSNEDGDVPEMLGTPLLLERLSTVFRRKMSTVSPVDLFVKQETLFEEKSTHWYTRNKQLRAKL